MLGIQRIKHNKTKSVLITLVIVSFWIAFYLVLHNFDARSFIRSIIMFSVSLGLHGFLLLIIIKLRAKEIFFLSLLFAAFFFLLEIGFTLYLRTHTTIARRILYGHGRNLGIISVYRPHHYTLYTLMENYRNEEGTVHNNAGFRNTYNIKKDKDDSTYRIVFLGGSTTYTIGIKDNNKIFTKKLEDKINLEAKKRSLNVDVQVLNAGMGGATSAENLSRLIFLIEPYKPDLIIIQHGLNDVWPRLKGLMESDYSNYRSIWDKSNYTSGSLIKDCMYKIYSKSNVLTFIAARANISGGALTILQMVRNNRTKADIKNLNINGPEIFRRNTELMCLVAKHIGSDVILASSPYTERAGRARNIAMPQHNNILKQIAKKMKVHFFDLYEVFPKNDNTLPDGRHVSEVGSVIKSQLYYDYLLNVFNLMDRLEARYSPTEIQISAAK